MIYSIKNFTKGLIYGIASIPLILFGCTKYFFEKNKDIEFYNNLGRIVGIMLFLLFLIRL